MTNTTENNLISSPINDDDVILSIENVSKKFCRNLKQAYVYGLKDIAAEVLGNNRASHKLRKGEFWALNNVSIDLKRGESLGLIGVNGSGKTTLLRIISGLIKPDTGSVSIDGRISALIALGAGFNPLLSGRENVYVNMCILGLSRKEIDNFFEQVVDFAEVWDAIDAPVRTYSSGMRARLGFACAVYTNPDILLIDEVLAVGDARFRTKCYRKLNELREKGTSFVLVSHSSNAILNICNSTLYLSKGKAIIHDATELVISKYQEDLLMIGSDAPKGAMANATHNSDDSEELHITSVFFKDDKGNTLNKLVCGKPAYLCIQCKAYKKVDSIIVGIIIREIGNKTDSVLSINSERDKQHLEILPGEREIQLKMPYCGLKPGIYTMKINISKRPFYLYDMVESFKFEVERNKKMNQCEFYQPRTWHID
ncbi:MAG: ATP-binding cassette domain-containing protein [Richelia sp. RM2_1_2]|nr:ATP-binding cassette domain-containing protein [Richelia sp. SM1_7_0]NJN10920.1 ATP-binding cassette domain-containing protein [Richelia sp. RM1_1_1]NJO30035.1 ATP-binding cassette domain-containing protein [Richelia sp. SL_2_1]NJO61421.1 ATP-binding cassette domain-containing protein [Richelia sp. RM2_1_2]